MKDINEWKKEVTDFNSNLTQLLESKSNLKDLYYGYEVIDGKLIDKPKILFIGINPEEVMGSLEKIYLKHNKYPISTFMMKIIRWIIQTDII